MDYTTQSLGFKIRKFARYLSLYGLSRTWIKVQGQYHMKKRYSTLPRVASPPPTGGHVGILGCGNFAFSNIAYYMRKNYGNVIRATMDIELERAASLYEKFGARYYSDNADDLIDDPDIDLLYIASNHATHATYAIRAPEKGKANAAMLKLLAKEWSVAPSRLGLVAGHKDRHKRILLEGDPAQRMKELKAWLAARHG